MQTVGTKEISLSQKWIDVLVDKPESGMGYQLVDVRLKNGTLLKNCVVKNSEFLMIPEGHEGFSTDDIEDLCLSTEKRT
jgi:hypothetical protein